MESKEKTSKYIATDSQRTFPRSPVHCMCKVTGEIILKTIQETVFQRAQNICVWIKGSRFLQDPHLVDTALIILC